jgi:hypothetical protein
MKIVEGYELDKKKMYILTEKKLYDTKLNYMQGLIALSCSAYRIDSSVHATTKRLSYIFIIL